MAKIIEVTTKGGLPEDSSQIYLTLDDLLVLANKRPHSRFSFLHFFFLEEEPGASIEINSYNSMTTITYKLISK